MLHPASTGRRYGIERSAFLRYMAAVSAIPTIALRADERMNTSPRFASNPFALGVASGDPEPDGVVIWTRLAPQPLDGGGMPNEPESFNRQPEAYANRRRRVRLLGSRRR